MKLAFAVALLLAPAAATAQAAPERLGPIVLRTDDGALELRPTLLTQLRLSATDRAGPGGRQTDGRLELHRLRAGVRIDLDEGVRGVVQLELAPRGPELIEAWVELRPHPAARVRAGQMKIPFTRTFEQSIAGLPLADWLMTARVFGGEHQLGVMVHDTDRAGAGLEYAVGLFGGDNRRGAHARELPGLYGEVHGNASSFRAPRAPDAPHPELVARVTHRAAGVPARTVMPSDVQGSGGGLRHAVSVSAAWDAAPARGRDFAMRVAPELRVEGPGLAVTAVGYGGLVPTERAPMEPGIVGASVELGWRPHRHVEVGLSFARAAVLPGLRDDARRYAASHLEDPTGQPGADARYAAAGRTAAWQELGLGVTVPIVGRDLAVASDVAWLRTERADGARDDLRVRAQLQLAL